jgi:hypothetical protein
MYFCIMHLCTYVLVELLSVVVYEGEGESHAQRVQLEWVGASLPKPAEHQNYPVLVIDEISPLN